MYEPPREVIEGGEDLSGMSTTNRRRWDDIESRVARRDIESQTRTDNIDTISTRTMTLSHG